MMTDISWGLLGPETLSDERRTRTLGLGALVRLFNDLAVPGLGGVWFGKELFLSTLGVQVAQKARERGVCVSNIETTNAIEAIACWLAFDRRKWARDDRLHGNTKMQGKSDLSFKTVRHPSFYITQPMRMATVQALPALGFVDADNTRFNAFKCTAAGQDFVNVACDGYSPFNTSVVDYLVSWVCGTYSLTTSPALCSAISPVEPLQQRALEMLRERLIQGGIAENVEDKKRRREALAWVDRLRKFKSSKIAWDAQPNEISNQQHWKDLHAGALFFLVREAAIDVLDQLGGCPRIRLSNEQPLVEFGEI
jgi:hypothetical protein